MCKGSRVENQGSTDYGFKVISFSFHLSMAGKLFTKNVLDSNMMCWFSKKLKIKNQ